MINTIQKIIAVLYYLGYLFIDFKIRTVDCRFLKRKFNKFWLYLFRPYPFQLWVAPRNNLYERLFSDGQKKHASPPGFIFDDENGNKQNEYAMFLYPDSLHTQWVIFFIFLFVAPALLSKINYIYSIFVFIEQLYEYVYCCLVGCLEVFNMDISICINFKLCEYIYLCFNECWKIFNLNFFFTHFLIDMFYIPFIFFVSFYYIIYSLLRRPVLDDVLDGWPDTEQQKKYFQSVPSRITFLSENHFGKYYKKFFLKNTSTCDKIPSLFRHPIRSLSLCIERLIFFSCVKTKTTSYFNRPVFFNPEGSFQEGILRTGIASFFAKENKIDNIFLFVFYCLPHIWVSYLYLCLKLMYIFLKENPYCSQEATIYLVVQIIFWLILSVLSLTKLSYFINNYLLQKEKNVELLSFAPLGIPPKINKKIRINKKTIQFLHPKITIPIITGLVFSGYLAVLNIALQYDDPRNKQEDSICIDAKSLCKKDSAEMSFKIKIK